MKRHYWQYLIDSAGNAVADARINVYLAGGITYANVYTTESGSPVTTEFTEILSGSDGMFDFWIDNVIDNPTYGYPVTQRFKITWSKAGLVTGGIDNLDIIWSQNSDYKVKVIEDDTENFLSNKLLAGFGIAITEVEVSGETKLRITGGTSINAMAKLLTISASAMEIEFLEEDYFVNPPVCVCNVSGKPTEVTITPNIETVPDRGEMYTSVTLTFPDSSYIGKTLHLMIMEDNS
jgi:hypothetical protein